MGRAAYSVLLTKAKPAYSDDMIEWEIPLSRGWALIHAARLLDGEPMIWPQLERSELGRAFMKLETRIKARRKALGLPED